MVTAGSFLKELVALERAAGLFQFRENGVSIWWFVRQRIILDLLGRLTGLDLLRKTADSLGTGGAIKMALRSLRYLVSYDFAHKPILALSTASARRHQTEDGYAFDVFCDFLRFVPGAEYAILELPDRTPHARKPFSKYVVYGDRITLNGNVGRVMFARRKCRGPMQELRDTIMDLARELGVELPVSEVERLILREVGFVALAVPTAERLLEQLRPKLLLVECGYAPGHMVVQLVAKRKGIPVLELQHGLITPDHPGYFFGLSGQYDMRDSPFPDGLLVYGEHFKRVLIGNPSICPASIIPVGYPYLQLEYKKRLRDIQKDEQEAILITSQPGLGEFWSDFAVSLAHEIDIPVIIKPHPAEYSQASYIFRQALESGKVKVIQDNHSLYDLFSVASCHLSVASTSHLEAIAFGLKDVIVPIHGLEQHFEFLRERGVPCAETPQDVAGLLECYPDIEPVRKFIREDVFALHQDAFQAIRSVIEKYL